MRISETRPTASVSIQRTVVGFLRFRDLQCRFRLCLATEWEGWEGWEWGAVGGKRPATLGCP